MQNRDCLSLLLLSSGYLTRMLPQFHHECCNQMSEYVCQSFFDPVSFDIHLESTVISHTYCCSGVGGD